MKFQIYQSDPKSNQRKHKPARELLLVFSRIGLVMSKSIHALMKIPDEINQHMALERSSPRR
jgi:hypothetical protein